VVLSPIAHRIIDQVVELPQEQQLQVLEFARELAHNKPHGVPGSVFVDFAGRISRADLDLMEQAIKDGCETISPDDW